MDYYFSIMGHGDALISASIMNKSSNKFVLICDTSTESILKYFFPNLEIRSSNLRCIYDFKKSSFFSILSSFMWVYRLIKALNKEDRIYFDKHDIRAVVFSYLTKAKYIRNSYNEKNIYLDRLNYINGIVSIDNYSSCNCYIPQNAKVAYFPISRIFSKNFTYETYSKLSHFLNIYSSRQIVYKHYLDLECSNKFSFNNYNDINELVSIINESDLLVVCDSLVLHVAYLLNKPFWVVFNNEINHKWLPPGAEENYILIHNDKIIKVGQNVNFYLNQNS